jgi:hypothetical protein
MIIGEAKRDDVAIKKGFGINAPVAQLDRAYDYGS